MLVPRGGRLPALQNQLNGPSICMTESLQPGHCGETAFVDGPAQPERRCRIGATTGTEYPTSREGCVHRHSRRRRRLGPAIEAGGWR
jgi:hypothetical protein